LFCPACGEPIFDGEKELTSRKFEGNKRLKMNLQMLFLFIPFLAFVAAYKVKKLKKFAIIYPLTFISSTILLLILLYVLDVVFSFGVWINGDDFYIYYILSPEYHLYILTGSQSSYYILQIIISIIITSLATSLFLVKIIRKWTIQWNNLFDIHSLLHDT